MLLIRYGAYYIIALLIRWPNTFLTGMIAPLHPVNNNRKSTTFLPNNNAIKLLFWILVLDEIMLFVFISEMTVRTARTPYLTGKP